MSHTEPSTNSLVPHSQSPSSHPVTARYPHLLSSFPPFPSPALTCQSPASSSWTCPQLRPHPLLDHLPAATPPAHSPSLWPQRLFLHSEMTPPLPNSQLSMAHLRPPGQSPHPPALLHPPLWPNHSLKNPLLLPPGTQLPERATPSLPRLHSNPVRGATLTCPSEELKFMCPLLTLPLGVQ